MLSRHPIVKRSIVNLNHNSGSTDSNKRIVLYAQLEISVTKKLNVTLVHFSYDRKQQCTNAKDIINFISSIASSNTVIMGDFNAYNDFEWPVKTIMEGTFPLGDCHLFSPGKSVGYGFVDAWTSVTHSDRDTGFTFSNMVRSYCPVHKIFCSNGGGRELWKQSILKSSGASFLEKHSVSKRASLSNQATN